MRKIPSRWVPHLLSNQNRADRVRLCREYLAKFRNQSWWLGDVVVTWDESWFYWMQIGHKQANASWVGEGESPRTIVGRDRFEPKTMVSILFRRSGVDQITYWNREANIHSGSELEKYTINS